MEIQYTLICLLLCSCSFKEEKPHYEATAFLEGIKFDYDTVNRGEPYVVKIIIDSSYHKMFGENPVFIDGDRESPILGEIFTMTYLTEDLTEDFNMQPDSVAKREVDFKVRLKKTTELDTVISIKKNYYVTNLESSRRTEGKLNTGRKVGFWRFWFDNGREKIKEESNWKQDQRHGKTTYYWENGKTREIQNYNNGELDGTLHRFNSAGELVNTIPYINGERVLTK